MSEKLAQRVALVAWPAAEWSAISRLLEAGALPHLRRLVERGVLGQVPGLVPEIEPLLYTSVATGVTADRHGVLSAGECTTGTRAGSRKTKALWNILGDAGMRSLVVNWPGQFAAEPIEGIAVTADTANIQAITARLMGEERWDFLAVSYGLIRAASLETRSEDEGVLENAYRRSDTMLGRIVALSGENAAILLVSANGLRTDFPDDGAAERLLPWYSTRGFCCLAGPGTKSGQILHGASLLDIAPTVLALLGLPSARDMQGRPLLRAFTHPHVPAFISTWENEPAERIQNGASLMKRECALNRAAVYLDTARPHQAIPILQQLLQAAPADEACGLALAYAYIVAAEWEQLRRLLLFLSGTERASPLLAVMRAMLSVVGGNVAEALALLRESERAAAGFPMLAYGIGCVYLRLRKWRRAERAFRLAAERNPEFWLAQQAQALVLNRLGRRREAADLLRAGIDTNLAASGSHYLLGAALPGFGDRVGVRRTFQNPLVLARAGR